MTTVAAVVVTFNRKELVTQCLDRLAHQTRPLDRIYVIDNASTDGTKERLAERGFLSRPDISYVRLDKNSGGAGGFHEGMRLAHEAGFDWIWIMDDDGEPTTDSLALMTPLFDRTDLVAVMPMIADANGDPDFSAPHRGFMKTRSEIVDGEMGRSLTRADIAGKSEVDINYYSFVGPCFPRWVIDRVGLPLRQFFIHYDDIEFSQRIAPLGRAIVVTAARILHKEAQTVGHTETAGPGKRVRHRYDRLWIRYFGYRNLTWLVMRGKLDAPRLPIFLRHAKLIARILLFEDHKWRRVRFWNAALLDGLLGRFDNDKPRAILG